jgi:hypothetical protein
MTCPYPGPAQARPKKLGPTCPVGRSWAGFLARNNRAFYWPGPAHKMLKSNLGQPREDEGYNLNGGAINQEGSAKTHRKNGSIEQIYLKISRTQDSYSLKLREAETRWNGGQRSRRPFSDSKITWPTNSW